MSKKQKNRWTKDYARQVLEQIERSGKSDVEMARKLGRGLFNQLGVGLR